METKIEIILEIKKVLRTKTELAKDFGSTSSTFSTNLKAVIL